MLPSVHLDDKYLNALIAIRSPEDIPPEWKGSPIESFIMAQNFGWPVQTTGKPELLVASCIEFRYALPVPRMYAYVIRRASGRLIGSEFSVAYTISRGVQHVVLTGHNDCGMSQLAANKPGVIDALVDQGWRRDAALEYVERMAKIQAIDNELDALKEEYKRLRKLFKKLVIAPLFVCLFDNQLYLPKWYHEVEAELRREPTELYVSDEVINNLR